MWRKSVFYVLSILLLLLLLESISALAIRVVSPRLDTPILKLEEIYRLQTAAVERLLDGTGQAREQVDSVLGWRYLSGFESSTDHINSQGVRSKREYSVTPPHNVYRIAAFGDSFVYGNEVSDEDCWSHLVEEADSTIEVLNYGVGAYGTDQAYLRYSLEGLRFSPQLVLIGFVPVNLQRTVNVYRRFISPLEFAGVKPRFVLHDDTEMSMLPVPIRDTGEYRYLAEHPHALRELGKHDHWYTPLIYRNPLYDWSATVRLATEFWTRFWRRYLDPNRLLVSNLFSQSSEAYRLQLALLLRFARDVRDSGRDALVVIFPGRESLRRVWGGDQSEYMPLMEDLKREGVRVLDLADYLGSTPYAWQTDALFQPGGHYSAEGNAVVARALVDFVTARRTENARAQVLSGPTRAGVGHSP